MVAYRVECVWIPIVLLFIYSVLLNLIILKGKKKKRLGGHVYFIHGLHVARNIQ